jgi:hypothetical protein
VYFKYVDQDYKDLKKILGIDPLEITIVKCGTFRQYEEKRGKLVRRVNPPYQESSILLKDYARQEEG